MALNDLNEKGRPILITDPRFGHAEVRGTWDLPCAPEQQDVFDTRLDLETRREYARKLDEAMAPFAKQVAVSPELLDTAEYDVPGCPEEPDVTAHVIVYTPKSLKRAKNPVIFAIEGGGLMQNGKTFLDGQAIKHDCVVVTCDYRTALYGGYPATINDLHAAFAWMIEHADELRIDPDDVVLYGESSGGHLALALPFRLRRYGIKNLRGTVAIYPVTDDRTTYRSSRLWPAGGWNCNVVAGSNKTWLGELYNSPHLAPEAFANRATVEECRGYPPCFIHTAEFDPDVDANREFSGKLLAAGAYCEYHEWGGVQHGSFDSNPEAPYTKRYLSIVDGNVADCLTYDLRRPWLDE